MSEPRKHHYIPQCYLRNFSIANKRKQVFLLDAKHKVQCATSIANVAQRRDFNRVDIDGVDPNSLEKHFSKLEDKVSSSIKMITEGGNFKGDVKDNILNLIALLAVRSPQKRSGFAQSYAHTAKLIMDLSLATKERWDAAVEHLPNIQHASYEEAKDFFENERYTIHTPRETHIRDELKMFNAILPYLYARKWQLITSISNSQIFFTCDNPVAISWNEPNKIPVIYRSSPGFRQKETTVFFPLTSNNFLIGRFDIDDDGYVDATDEMVSACNLNTVSNTYEQIYASSLDAYIQTDTCMKFAIKELISNLK